MVGFASGGANIDAVAGDRIERKEIITSLRDWQSIQSIEGSIASRRR